MRRCAIAGVLALSGCGDDGVAPADTDGTTGGTTTTSSSASSDDSSSTGDVDGSSSDGTSSTTGADGGLPPTFPVEGTVVDQDGVPVPDAWIMQGGYSAQQPWLQTDAAGGFTIELQYPGYGKPGVVAAKPGYRTSAAEFQAGPPEEPVTITLRAILGEDNEAYEFLEPGTGVDDPTTAQCGHCHESFARQFQASKHAEATRNPLLQSLYAGVDGSLGDAGSCGGAGGSWLPGLEPGTTEATNKCYVGRGVLPDLNESCGGAAQQACDDPALTPADAPTAFGRCADCHAPGIDGVAGGRNLHDATGIAFDNGVHCDVCHKVRDIDLDQPAGIGSRLVLHRPAEPPVMATTKWLPVTFGPLVDVPNPLMAVEWQPKFNEAVFCAGCHLQRQAALLPGETLDAKRWPDGLPIHDTYQEWLDGPYGAAEVPCQHCHMPADYELVNSTDVTMLEDVSVTFGYARPPEDNRQHLFRGPLAGEDRLIDGALFVSVDLELDGADVEATVSVTNIGCGHAVPTGEPMRALVMLVSASGAGCGPLPATDGMTVYDAGGALASGVEGADATTSGTTITWAAGAAVAQPGMVLRVVRDSGAFDDYTGVGVFDTLPAAEKGLPVMTPVAQAVVSSVGADQIDVDTALTLQAGDVLHLGQPVPDPIADGPAGAYAGHPGYAFAKILIDGGGERQAPHYRAIDIASDNRIPPGRNAITRHTFSAAGCTDATVEVRVLYRPHPLALAQTYGWSADDHLVASAESTIDVP